ncbi:MAG: hypothetical protein OEW19_22675, partial [Acidobacteriota bacterium]|nr:hypothetical protein [Acidobacteriota bacterium]
MRLSPRPRPPPPDEKGRSLLDLRLIRAEPERVRAALARRGSADGFDALVALDRDCRSLRTQVEETRAERTRSAKAIGEAKKAGRDASAAEAEARALGERLGALEDELRVLEGRRDADLLVIP